VVRGSGLGTINKKLVYNTTTLYYYPHPPTTGSSVDLHSPRRNVSDTAVCDFSELYMSAESYSNIKLSAPALIMFPVGDFSIANTG
jgi:hypothetical protein